MERGGFLECSLLLYDEAGREIAYSEDQDEYLETPRMTVVYQTLDSGPRVTSPMTTAVGATYAV